MPKYFTNSLETNRLADDSRILGSTGGIANQEASGAGKKGKGVTGGTLQTTEVGGKQAAGARSEQTIR